MKTILQAGNGITGILHKGLQTLIEFAHCAGGAPVLTALLKLLEFTANLIDKLDLTCCRLQLCLRQ